MTQFTDKPKRKEKPKRGYNTLRLGLLAVITALVLFLMLHDPSSTPPAFPEDIFNPPDGDPLTPRCQLESNPHIFVGTRAGSYITDMAGEKQMLLPDGFDRVRWHTDSQYGWVNGDSAHGIVNLETGETTMISQPQQYSYMYWSPTVHYVLKLQLNDNSIHDLIIYDHLQKTVVLEAI